MDPDYVPGYDTAVLPVLEWVQSSDWMDTYLAHDREFYAELASTFEGSVDEILMGLPAPLFARAVRCSFDDFLTTEYESTPRNALDEYLEEFGSALEKADVDFLKVFRGSVVRLYHVVERTPYESVLLRDVSDGLRPIQIDDEFLTAGLSTGDTIATRIVTVDDRDHLAGSILVINDETLAMFQQAFDDALKAELLNVEKYLRKDPRQRNLVRQRVMKGAAPALSGMWAASVLLVMASAPSLANERDPETVFQASITYTSELEPLVAFLDNHPDLDRLLPRDFIWLWHTDRTNPEASLKAILWISGVDVLIESCDQARIEEAVATLEEMLGDSVEEVSITELDDDEDDEEDDSLPLAPMTEEEETDFRIRMHAYLDEQFRMLLDQPVAALRDQAPRELAKSVKGRKQLSKWLVSLEDGLRANPNRVGMADYDSTWMWKELGMEDMRQSSLFDE
ncbi:MAG: hypothetical protein P4L46_04840 [Fimbriimonas sp.]|nr:hypothetical protein [Fimbriimonas sp.]